MPRPFDRVRLPCGGLFLLKDMPFKKQRAACSRGCLHRGREIAAALAEEGKRLPSSVVHEQRLTSLVERLLLLGLAALLILYRLLLKRPDAIPERLAGAAPWLLGAIALFGVLSLLARRTRTTRWP